MALRTRLIQATSAHSPIIYGNWVETYGPYLQDYMRSYFVFRSYL